MQAERCDSPSAFLSASFAYRSAEPLRTNVLATVAAEAATYGSAREGCAWWLLRDDAGTVVGAAMRTPPFQLALGPMSTAAAAALAAAVAASDDTLPGVGGPPNAVDAFVAAYAATGSPGSRREIAASRRDVLRAVGDLVRPTVAGAARVATAAEHWLVERWFGDFDEEVDNGRFTPTEEDRARLRRLVEEGRLWWWVEEGEIVSMAGHNVPIETEGAIVTRIGPVFTPKDQRRRGYAAGLTAALTAALFERGSTVMLFADDANATSNGVYHSLGFLPVETFTRVVFRPTS